MIISAISLHQPFASAIFTPIRSNPSRMIKRDETRSRAYPARLAGQRVAIHAAKKVLSRHALSAAMESEAFLQFGGEWRDVLDFGQFIGTVALGACRPTDKVSPEYLNRMFGDWSADRFAWELLDPKPLASPIPCIGRQSWFTVDLPEGA